jgi:large subunit ribosomal protein L22
MEAKAITREIPISPTKVRRVLDQIRGRSYKDALLILGFMPYRACTPILKTLYSAASNASHNYDIKRDDLIISEAYADQGTIRKRFQPRAQGRAYAIQRPTCHLTIIVKSREGN